MMVHGTKQDGGETVPARMMFYYKCNGAFLQYDNPAQLCNTTHMYYFEYDTLLKYLGEMNRFGCVSGAISNCTITGLIQTL